MDEVVFDKLHNYAKSIFYCALNSYHGPAHWRKVEDTVILLTPETGADIVVGRLFAIFHDCCRVNDEEDIDHGPRAAKFIHRILGSKIHLDAKRGKLLEYAVHHHTSGMTSKDPTIGTCWDADRLDLGRVGIIPSASRMSTAAGKEIAQTVNNWE